MKPLFKGWFFKVLFGNDQTRDEYTGRKHRMKVYLLPFFGTLLEFHLPLGGPLEYTTLRILTPQSTGESTQNSIVICCQQNHGANGFSCEGFFKIPKTNQQVPQQKKLNTFNLGNLISL